MASSDRPRKNDGERLSLHPLSFDEAMRRLVPPVPKKGKEKPKEAPADEAPAKDAGRRNGQGRER